MFVAKFSMVFLPLTSPRSASNLEQDRKSLLQLHDDIAALKAKFDADKSLCSETLTAHDGMGH